MTRQYVKESGFALPTILIASVVMLLVLMSALQTIVTARLGITERHYQQLASEAAEAGLKVAEGCMKADATYSATWSVGNPLNTGDDCTGTPISGVVTTVVSQDSPVKLATSYSVAFPDNTQNPVIVEAVGTVELRRTSNNAVWKTYTATKKMSLSRSIKSVSQIASGRGFSCAIFDGESWCFGRNSYGTLGVGKCHDDPSPTGTDFTKTTVVPSCDRGTMHVSLTPIRVARESGVLKGKVDKLIATGVYVACVASTDPADSLDSVYCWGDNQSGQLGLGGTSSSLMAPYPQKITHANLQGKTVTDLQVGRNRVCAAASGDVYCWGLGTGGALGNNSTVNSGVPVKVQGVGVSDGRPVEKIATAPDMDTTCAIIASGTSSGHVYCWGRNQRGQLGNNATTNRLTAVRAGSTLSPNPLTNVISLAGGGGLTNQDTDYDVSTGTVTNLGVDSTTVTTSGRITLAQFCAVTSAKKLYCWGSNQYGQLGIGLSALTSNGRVSPRDSRSLVPVQPNRPLVYDTYPTGYTYLAPFDTTPTVTSYGISMNNASVKVEQVAVSYASMCALLSAPSSVSGKVFCVGQNSYGIGRSGRRSTSITYNNDLNQVAKNNFYQMITNNIPSSDAVTSITGNTNRMCAIAGGRLYCLGHNGYGQLGVGDTTTYTIPTDAKVLRQFDTIQIY